MNYLTFFFSMLLIIGSKCLASDLGFRFRDGKCVNSQEEIGLNPSFFGPCSDLRGVTLYNLNFEGVDFSGSQFSSSDLQRISFKRANLTGVNFERAILLGVNFDESQVHMVNFQRTTLRKVSFSEADIQKSSFVDSDLRANDLNYVRIEECDLTRANFSEAQLEEIEIQNSKLIDTNLENANLRKSKIESSQLVRTKFFGSNLELANISDAQGEDVNFLRASLKNAIIFKSKLIRSKLNAVALMNATISYTDFSHSVMKSTDLTGVHLQDVILKDVNYSARTKLPFSQEKAREFGMILSITKLVLILWDELNDYVRNFAEGLEKISEGEIKTVMSPSSETQFAGQYSLVDYDAVIHFNGKDGASSDVDLPESGQKAIVEYVQNGGTFIYGEWQAFAVKEGRYRFMRDTVLFSEKSIDEGAMTVTFSSDGMKSPIFNGLSNPVRVNLTNYNQGSVVPFEQNPVEVLATDSEGNPVIGTRKYGNGLVVGFSFTCTFRKMTCLNEESIRRLYSNAVFIR